MGNPKRLPLSDTSVAGIPRSAWCRFEGLPLSAAIDSCCKAAGVRASVMLPKALVAGRMQWLMGSFAFVGLACDKMSQRYGRTKGNGL